MPIHSRASVRYARALLLAAEKRDGLRPLREEVEALRSLVRDSPEFRAFLADPTISKQDKLSLMEDLFRGKVSPLMSQFLRMLTEKYRERLLPDVLETAVSLLDEREGKVIASVRAAVDLSDSQKVRLKGQLERLTGKEVKLDTMRDVALGAGFIARVGDTVFDASLGAQLQRIHQSFRRAKLREAGTD